MMVGKTRTGFQTANSRTPLLFFLFLVIGLPLKTLNAQTVRIRLVNGKTGSPMVNTCVNTWIGAGRKDAMAIPTDKDGVAQLHLTDKDAEVSTQSQPNSCGNFGVVHPVVKYADTIRIVAGYVVCQPHGPNYSWLATMEFSTKQVVQQGVATANTCGKATASPKPGEVIIFVRPLNWREKLKQ